MHVSIRGNLHGRGDLVQGEVRQYCGHWRPAEYSGNEQLSVFYLIEITKTRQYLSWSSLTSSDIIPAKQPLVFFDP